MKNVKIMEVASELGAGTRGARLGVEAIKTASLKKGNMFFRNKDVHVVKTENELLWADIDTPNGKRIEGIARMYERLADDVSAVLKSHFPFIIAGDHSSAGGTIAGIKKAYPNKRLGVIWVDAHADLHSPYTTPSGNVHGMPLATALGLNNEENQINEIVGKTKECWERMKNAGIPGPKVNPEDLVFIGVRSTEKPENFLIDKHNIKNFTVDEVRQKSIQNVIDEIKSKLKECDIVYISFDVDSMDASISLGTGTPVDGGFTQEEMTELLTELAKMEKVVCFELVEVNPCLDNKCNKMAEVAFEIIEELFKAWS